MLETYPITFEGRFEWMQSITCDCVSDVLEEVCTAGLGRFFLSALESPSGILCPILGWKESSREP